MGDPTDDLLPDVAEALTAAWIDGALDAVAGDLLPVGVKYTVAIVRALARRRATDYMRGVLTEGETVKEFVSWVNSKVAEDGDRVMRALVEGACAARDKAELAAVPSIGLLVRRYAAGSMPKWFYRGALDLLVSVGAVEFGDLCQIVHQLRTVECAHEFLTITARKGPAVIFAEGDVESTTPLDYTGPSLVRYMRLLKQNGLGHESGGYGSGGSPKVVCIEAQTVGWLCEIMPVSQPRHR